MMTESDEENFDPYEMLGVEPTATDEEIKKAFRKASSAAHPDREGGSEERQSAINKAWGVLGDPINKQRYDATGRTHKPKDPDGLAVEVLCQMFQAALNEDSPNLLKRTESGLQQLRMQADQQARIDRQRSENLKRRLGKIRRKSGKMNVLSTMIDQQFTRVEAARVHNEGIVEQCDRALVMLQDFESDEAVVDRVFVNLLSSGSATGTTTGVRFLGS